MLGSPLLVRGRKGRDAGLIVFNAEHIIPVVVDLLKGGLNRQGHVRVGVGQRNIDHRQGIAEAARIDLETPPSRPAVHANEIFEGFRGREVRFRDTHDVAAMAQQVDLDQVAFGGADLPLLGLVRVAPGAGRFVRGAHDSITVTTLKSR